MSPLTRISNVFRSTPVRTRILFVCLATFIPFIVATGWFTYTVMRSSLETQITSELRLLQIQTSLISRCLESLSPC